MTTEAKEEIDLMVDKIADLTSELNDFQTSEEDDLDDFATGTDDRKLVVFNIKELKLAQTQLDKVKATLLNLVKQN